MDKLKLEIKNQENLANNINMIKSKEIIDLNKLIDDTNKSNDISKRERELEHEHVLNAYEYNKMEMTNKHNQIIQEQNELMIKMNNEKLELQKQ